MSVDFDPYGIRHPRRESSLRNLTPVSEAERYPARPDLDLCRGCPYVRVCEEALFKQQDR